MSQPARGNAPGPFRVTNDCIICSVCSDAAPEHFRINDAEDNYVVYDQPVTAEAIAACRDALSGCPVEAIEEVAGG